MYRVRPALTDTLDLDQGDILAKVQRPQAFTGKNLSAVIDGNKLKKSDSLETIEALRSQSQILRIISKIELVELCLVLSNSCDNCTENLPVFIAPARGFLFDSEEDQQRWLEISTAATGTANPRFFYLPDSPECGFERGEVQFNLMFPVSHDYLRRCVSEANTKRVCGPTPEAQMHLARALALFFGRHAREDYDWPSSNDIVLKLAWLKAKIAEGGRFQDRYQEDLVVAQAKLNKRSSKA